LVALNRVLTERRGGLRFNRFDRGASRTGILGKFSRELNLKSFAQVKTDYRRKHPGSIADANESLPTATMQFSELEVQGELTKRARA
jgi:hypothetical protein